MVCAQERGRICMRDDLSAVCTPLAGDSMEAGAALATSTTRGVGDSSASLFFDVDGTLVQADPENIPEDEDFTAVLPTPGVLDAIGRLRARGHHAYICTGRPLSMVSDALVGAGFDGVVSAAGSCVSLGGEVVHETLIDSELAAELIRLVLAMDTTVMFESRETPIVVSRTLEAVPAFSNVPVAHSFEEALEHAPDLRFCKFTQPRMLKAPSIMGDVRLRELIETNFDACDMGLASEYSQKGVTKASGIAKVLELTGRGVAGTFAFGDSENDLPMFDAVETRVAMGNAMPALKDRADYVTEHVKDDGAVHALRHFGLI